MQTMVRMTIVQIICLTLVVSLLMPAAAQETEHEQTQAQTETPSPENGPSPPACTTDRSPYRDFDFWVGDWEVFDPKTGNKIGENRITTRERGCLLVERWTANSGGTGMSMNFYDPLESAWRQVWQSAAAFIDYTGGLDDQGRMLLEGTIHYNARNTSNPFRGRWTPRADGTVLQEFWQLDEESGEWTVWFSGEYRRR